MSEPERFDWRGLLRHITPYNVFIWMMLVFMAALGTAVISFIATWLWRHA